MPPPPPHSSSPPACPVCSGETVWLRYQLAQFNVYQCKDCDLCFRHPLPSSSELIAMYEDETYHESAYFRASPRGRLIRSPETRVFKRALAELQELAPRGRLLDVGCGPGVFLGLAREAGWQVHGVELSRRHVERAKNTVGVEPWQGEFLAAPLASGSFEVITMWDFLEHVLDPRAVLARAHELLKPNGILLVFTIDTSSLFNSTGDLLYRLTAGHFARPVELLYDARHNYYFTLRSLSTLLDRSGFTVERWRSDRAYLGRWVSEPAPWYLYAGGFVLDLLSLAVGRPYRRTAYCRPEAPASR